MDRFITEFKTSIHDSEEARTIHPRSTTCTQSVLREKYSANSEYTEENGAVKHCKDTGRSTESIFINFI